MDRGYLMYRAMEVEESDALCMKIASYLVAHGSDVIGNDEFRAACIACNVDPTSITQRDLDLIQRELNRRT